MLGSLLAVEPRVIGQRVDAQAPQILCQAIDLGARAAIDDAARAATLRGDEARELAQFVAPLCKGEREIGTREGTHEDLRLPRKKHLRNVGARARCCARRDREDRRIAELTRDLAQPAILGTKIVPPGGNAMGLVDRQQRHAPLGEQRQSPTLREPLGRDIEQLDTTRSDTRAGLHVIRVILGRMQGRSGEARLRERAQLIAHQRDERRDDDDEPELHRRRKLIEQRLPRARRHDGQHVAPREHRLDDLGLPGKKLCKAESLAQSSARVV